MKDLEKEREKYAEEISDGIKIILAVFRFICWAGMLLIYTFTDIQPSNYWVMIFLMFTIQMWSSRSKE